MSVRRCGDKNGGLNSVFFCAQMCRHPETEVRCRIQRTQNFVCAKKDDLDNNSLSQGTLCRRASPERRCPCTVKPGECAPRRNTGFCAFCGRPNGLLNCPCCKAPAACCCCLTARPSLQQCCWPPQRKLNCYDGLESCRPRGSCIYRPKLPSEEDEFPCRPPPDAKPQLIVNGRCRIAKIQTLELPSLETGPKSVRKPETTPKAARKPVAKARNPKKSRPKGKRTNERSDAPVAHHNSVADEDEILGDQGGPISEENPDGGQTPEADEGQTPEADDGQTPEADDGQIFREGTHSDEDENLNEEQRLVSNDGEAQQDSISDREEGDDLEVREVRSCPTLGSRFGCKGRQKNKCRCGRNETDAQLRAAPQSTNYCPAFPPVIRCVDPNSCSQAAMSLRQHPNVNDSCPVLGSEYTCLKTNDHGSENRQTCLDYARSRAGNRTLGNCCLTCQSEDSKLSSVQEGDENAHRNNQEETHDTRHDEREPCPVLDSDNDYEVCGTPSTLDTQGTRTPEYENAVGGHYDHIISSTQRRSRQSNTRNSKECPVLGANFRCKQIGPSCGGEGGGIPPCHLASPGGAQPPSATAEAATQHPLEDSEVEEKQVPPAPPPSPTVRCLCKSASRNPRGAQGEAVETGSEGGTRARQDSAASQHRQSVDRSRPASPEHDTSPFSHDNGSIRSRENSVTSRQRYSVDRSRQETAPRHKSCGTSTASNPLVMYVVPFDQSTRGRVQGFMIAFQESGVNDKEAITDSNASFAPLPRIMDPAFKESGVQASFSNIHSGRSSPKYSAGKRSNARDSISNLSIIESQGSLVTVGDESIFNGDKKSTRSLRSVLGDSASEISLRQTPRNSFRQQSKDKPVSPTRNQLIPSVVDKEFTASKSKTSCQSLTKILSELCWNADPSGWFKVDGPTDNPSGWLNVKGPLDNADGFKCLGLKIPSVCSVAMQTENVNALDDCESETDVSSDSKRDLEESSSRRNRAIQVELDFDEVLKDSRSLNPFHIMSEEQMGVETTYDEVRPDTTLHDNETPVDGIGGKEVVHESKNSTFFGKLRARKIVKNRKK